MSDHQNRDCLTAQQLHRSPGRSGQRLVVVASLQIMRECISFEIVRRYGPMEVLHAATIEAAVALSHAAGDLLIVDASHAESPNAPLFLRAAFPEARIILLMADRITNLGIAETVNLPPTYDALLFLVGAALGVQPTRQEKSDETGTEILPPLALPELVDDWSQLTPREREVTAGLLEGKGNKVIAFDLGLSDNTVKMHLTHIMQKLKVTNRTQVALLIGRSHEHREPVEAQRTLSAPAQLA